MYLYINATDPRKPIELSWWGKDGWQEQTFSREDSKGPLQALDLFLKEQNKTAQDIRALFVFMGKGSFTATRSIATVANALALALAVTVVAVSEKPNRDPEQILKDTPKGKYILPYYSEPARIGPSSAKASEGAATKII